MDGCQIIPLARGAAAVYCAPNPVGDHANEDASMVVPVSDGATILAVADGMGGQPAGQRASEVALDALATSVGAAVAPGNAREGSLRTAILDGFEAANERVAAAGSGAGTTLAVVAVEGDTVRPYHVGDSAIVVLGQRGKIRLHTVSHSPVGYAVESGLLDASDAMHHEDRHIVSNFVGAPDMHIEVGPPLVLRPRDTLVMGSDGLFDNLHLEEVVSIVRKGPLPGAAEALAKECRRRMTEPEPGHPSKPDDVTFILYRWTPASS